MNPSDTMRQYAVHKILALMDDVISAMKHAVEAPDEEAVHKARVAIRRFQQAMRLFREYLKPRGVERIKGRLHAIMQVAGELRNRDIAIALTKDPGANTIVLADQRAELDKQFTTLDSASHLYGIERQVAQAVGPGHRMKKLWKDHLTLQQNLRRRMPKLARQYFDEGRDALAPGTAWTDMHKFRLRTKRFVTRSRYSRTLYVPRHAEAHRVSEAGSNLSRRHQRLHYDVPNSSKTWRGWKISGPSYRRKRTKRPPTPGFLGGNIRCGRRRTRLDAISCHLCLRPSRSASQPSEMMRRADWTRYSRRSQTLGGRLTVRLQPLDLRIGVRIPASQPNKNSSHIISPGRRPVPRIQSAVRNCPPIARYFKHRGIEQSSLFHCRHSRLPSRVSRTEDSHARFCYRTCPDDHNQPVLCVPQAIDAKGYERFVREIRH